MIKREFLKCLKLLLKHLSKKQSLIAAIAVLISLASYFFIIFYLGPKTDQVQIMIHYNDIAKFLQMLKTNLFGVEMNFTVVYRVT